MNRLLTIYRQKNINLKSKSILKRVAYRAIIIKNNQILVVKSNRYGEMKFPGGGKENHESAFDVLSREVMEETGYQIKSKIRPFVSTMEYAKDFKGEYDIFIQDSRYYFCDIYDKQNNTAYSGYEIEYGYHPLWVTLEEAIANNELVSANDLIPWLERDTMMFKHINETRLKP